jgi:flagellar basal-body rod protein FlgB
MFLERLINQGTGPVLEQMLQFTTARRDLLAENVANVDTPGYVQKDLDLQKFQTMLRDRIEYREHAGSGSAGFEEVTAEVEHPEGGILFHDGNNRSMESLMSDQAKNAMMHNMVIEMLRKQYQQLDMALKERVS